MIICNFPLIKARDTDRVMVRVRARVMVRVGFWCLSTVSPISYTIDRMAYISPIFLHKHKRATMGIGLRPLCSHFLQYSA